MKVPSFGPSIPVPGSVYLLLHLSALVGIASLLHASFRPRLAASVISPLRFAITSPPSRCEEDFHLQTVKHCSAHRKMGSPKAPHVEQS
jgi:hypothetical protein